MSIQGTQIIDVQYFENLKSAIDGVQTCIDLKEIAREASQAIAAAQAAIAAELAALQPLLDLLTAPGANLAQIVTYLKKLIDTLITPLVKPTITYAAQLAAIATQLVGILSAIEAAAHRIGNCSVSFP